MMRASSTLSTLRALADPRQLGYLIVYVTNRCNFTCDFCFYHHEIAKGRKPDELTVAEFEQIARKLGPLAQLSLTGGEPFLRKDFTEVATALLTHTHARWVTIPTNGWFTDRMETSLTALIRAFPASNFRVVLSIEAIGAEHDRIRAKPGSFDKLRESHDRIGALRRRHSNLVLDANTVFSEDSKATVIETLRHLDTHFSFDNLSMTYARGDIKDPSLLPTERAQYQAARQFLLARDRPKEGRLLSSVWRAVDDVSHERFDRTVFGGEFVSTCVAGRKLAVLGETGEVYACEVIEQSIGNVRAYNFSLPDVLADHDAKRLRQHIRESRCTCSFECAHAATTVWHPGHYPRVAELGMRGAIQTLLK
ncbi:MAG: radical SAM protein [Myxococcales bacterium]|nr:radical SAM protein [Myxococcales bacterium]